MSAVSQVVADGLVDGAAVGLGAAGLVLVHRRWGVLNLAHGGLLALGAFAAYVVQTRAGGGPWLAIAVATGAVALVAAGGEIGVWAPLRRRGASGALAAMAALGLAFVILGGLTAVWPDGARLLGVADPRVVDVSDAVVRRSHLIGGLGLAIGVVAAAWWGRSGVGARASREGDSALLAWTAAGALAGLAGAVVALREGASADLVLALLPPILAAAAVARFASVVAAGAAGLGVGVIDALVLRAIDVPGGAPVVATGVLVLALLADAAHRPRTAGAR